MNVKKIRSRKALKLLGLLISSILIATVSAGVYYSLSMTSTIQVATTDVWFVKGADNGTAGVNLSPQNTSATLTALKAYPNASYTYTDPLRVRNNGSVPANVRLSPFSLSGTNDGNFTYVYFGLRNGTHEDNATLASLNYTRGVSEWTIPPTTDWVSIPASTDYAITVITKAKDNATSAQVEIGIEVDVE
jgi:hypothetical protein